MKARQQPQRRVELSNAALSLDFDPRTSDTMYNYIHVRRPDTGQFVRVHNFGIDVRGPRSAAGPAGSPQESADEINTVGLCLDLRREGNRLTVRYPRPLVQYRQFDDNGGSPETVRKYPDFSLDELPSLVHADAEVEFVYELDASRPSFTVTGRVLSGVVNTITYIVDALWTDNHACPTHEYVEGFPEFDIRSPDAPLCRMVDVENVAFAVFYRHDGNGVPLALLPLEPLRSAIVNFYDNWKCDYDFHAASCNQAYVPDRPCVTGCNDAGYVVAPQAGGRLPGVRVAFFPELSHARGGMGHDLRRRIVDAIHLEYFSAARSWDRPGKWLPGRMTLTSSLGVRS